MQWVSVLCGLISATMQRYVTVLTLVKLSLGMKKVVLFPFGMRLPNPWASLPRSLINAVTHVSASSSTIKCFYSCGIPVTGSITSLASKWIHVLCAVRICVVRAYLEAVWTVLG